MKLGDQPIKQKLMIVTLATSSLALLLTCIALVTYEVITYRGEVVANMRALASITAANSSAAAAFGDATDAGEVLTSLAVEPQVVAAATYTEIGELLARYASANTDAQIDPSLMPQGERFIGAHLHVSQPIKQAGAFKGTFVLVADLWPMYRRLLFYGIVAISVGGLATLAAVGLSTLLQRRISGPLAELASVARTVSKSEDYSARAKKHGNDEIGQLTDAFNQMLTRIDQSRAELQESEERLRVAKEAAEAANAAKDSFLAILSHELRTPLTPVLATVSLMEEDPQLSERAREDLQTIRRNVGLEARLIDDLLDVTRIARGKLELHREVVNACALLEDAIAGYCKPEAARKGFELIMQKDATRCFVNADPSRLTQVFWNLLQNACKFTNEGGRIEIRVTNLDRGNPEGPLLAIAVQDNGIGIDPEMLPRIFDAFEQGERTRTRLFGGLGLGLAISRAIVELHGGSLRAESEGVGKGATFTVHLATVPEPVPGGDLRDRGASPAQAAGEGKASRSPLSILLVEDHADTANQMSRLLRRLGHEVTVAGTLADARAAAGRLDASASLDLVLSDLGLPDGNGHDLMRELSGRYGVSGVALSGYGMEEDVRASIDAGFACHLTKPVNWDALREIITKFAERPTGKRARPAGVEG